MKDEGSCGVVGVVGVVGVDEVVEVGVLDDVVGVVEVFAPEVEGLTMLDELDVDDGVLEGAVEVVLLGDVVAVSPVSELPVLPIVEDEVTR